MSGIIQATNLQVDNIKSSGGTSAMTIDSSGKVGVNNSSPSGCKLEVSYANADVGNGCEYNRYLLFW